MTDFSVSTERPAPTVARVFEYVETRPTHQRMSLRQILRLYFDQGHIIFKGRRSCGQPWARIAPRPDLQRLALRTACDRPVAALFAPALDEAGHPHHAPRTCPTILFFYGNDMCLAQSMPVMQLLRTLGVNVMVPEYVGYGLSPGTPTEQTCYATANAAYEALLARDDIDPTRIYALGASLGGAVAIDLAARRPLAGLVTLITFTSMIELGQVLMPRAPLRWVVRHRFDSLSKMPRITCPSLIIHSHGDELIPHVMADRLATAAGGPVTRVDLDAVGHRRIELMEVAQAQLVPVLQQFLRATAP